MAEGDVSIGTADEVLARLRESPGQAIQTSFPFAGVDLYILYSPGCGHYQVRVVTLGADPTDPEYIRIIEAELTQEEVIWRMCSLMEADMERDPMGYEQRMTLELLGRELEED
ncbi:MAG TPA: hypothetical protein VF867_00200 [Arthrobacter sp.]